MKVSPDPSVRSRRNAPKPAATAGQIDPSGSAGSEVPPQLSALYGEHSVQLLRFAAAITRNRDEGLDCVQETFLRYLEAHLAGIPIPNPQAWMFSVIRNLAVDEVRRSRQTRIASLSADADAAERAWMELERSLEALLTNRELDCVRLRMQGLTHAEIARRLRVRPGTVASLLSRASAKARQAGILPGPTSTD